MEEKLTDDLKIKVHGPWEKLLCMFDEEASAPLNFSLRGPAYHMPDPCLFQFNQLRQAFQFNTDYYADLRRS